MGSPGKAGGLLKGIYGEINSREFIVRRNDGDDRSILANAAPIRDTLGNIKAGIVVFTDITERKQTQEALRKSEEKFKMIFNNAPIGLMLTDSQCVAIDCNQHFAEIFGARKENYLGMELLTTIPEGEIRQLLSDVLADHLVHSYEGPYTSQVTGKKLYLNIICQRPTSDHVIIIINDITNKIETEREKVNLTQRLQLATSSARLGIWDWNVKENTMVWDERMFELYGITPEEFPNSIAAWMNGLHPEDKEFAIAESQAALSGEKSFDTDFRVLHPDGTVKCIRGKGLVLRGADGKAERMLGINYDITDEKKSVQDRAKLESQLQQAQKMESVGRLAGGVAHDFNNMLGVILGHAELGLMHLDPTHPVCSDLKEISKTAERSADLTRQLLAFARKQTVSPKVVDLNDIVTNMLKMLQRLIGEDIQLVWQPSSGQCQIKMDPSQIDQIMANLCVNARDAIESIGRITIETGTCSFDTDSCTFNPDATPGDYVRLIISDNGKGMDRETQAHIFEPFYTTKEMGKGTGLGLATVYGAVKQNNGFINIYSESGKGTTFSIYLPRYQEQIIQNIAEQISANVPRGQETILLVEDEAAILNITAIMLEQMGYTVLKTGSPVRAVELAQEHTGKIHLLMTDVIMPEMNGRDLARNILTIHPAMKILFMSGYTADVIAQHGVLDEGVHFIQKPFSQPNMAAKVREVLDGFKLG